MESVVFRGFLFSRVADPALNWVKEKERYMFGVKAYAKVGIESQVNSASPHQLIVMLYDGLLESMRFALICMQNKNPVQKGAEVNRALRILQDGLMSSLDFEKGGDISKQLMGVYEYVSQNMVIASARNDEEKMQVCIAMIENIREAWVAIGTSGGVQ
jgi:flagellar protein FliS